MKDVTLKIHGMKCGTCVSSVREALENASGVRRAEVSLEESEARVSAEDTVDAEALVAAVSRAGFEAAVAA